MSSSILLQLCPACLVRLILIVFVMGGRLPYCCCFVGCCLQDLFNIARSILELTECNMSQITRLDMDLLKCNMSLTRMAAHNLNQTRSSAMQMLCFDLRPGPKNGIPR